MTPISAPVRAIEALGRSDGSPHEDGSAERGAPPARPPAGAPPPPEGDGAAPGDLEALRRLAAQQQLELRLEAMPHNGIVRIRIVDAVTGQVVRDIPAEGVAGALEELRVRVMPNLDAKG